MVMGGPVLVWFRRWFCCALVAFLSASGGFVCVGWSRLCGSVRVGGLWPRPFFFFFWANLSLWGNFGAQHQAPQNKEAARNHRSHRPRPARTGRPRAGLVWRWLGCAVFGTSVIPRWWRLCLRRSRLGAFGPQPLFLLGQLILMKEIWDATPSAPKTEAARSRRNHRPGGANLAEAKH